MQDRSCWGDGILEKDENFDHITSWNKSNLSRRNNQCKGPEARHIYIYSRHCMEISGAGVQWARGVDIKEVMQYQHTWGFIAPCKAFDFYSGLDKESQGFEKRNNENWLTCLNDHLASAESRLQTVTNVEWKQRDPEHCNNLSKTYW